MTAETGAAAGDHDGAAVETELGHGSPRRRRSGGGVADRDPAADTPGTVDAHEVVVVATHGDEGTLRHHQERRDARGDVAVDVVRGVGGHVVHHARGHRIPRSPG